ncbi:DNA methyltransferase [Amycolatopsis ultiminotia]|uniref:DNA methyltransferase n=1 Tax=Amycolatopsis ultiminotia TaxID=543629 RepID=A0ABP6WHQ5_9PSEU
MPWRVAFALQNDGWLLRNAVIVGSDDGKYETVLFCVKQRGYYLDLAAARSVLGPDRGDVVLSGRAELADRVVLAACPVGGVVLDLTDWPEARAAADRWGRRIAQAPRATAVA